MIDETGYRPNVGIILCSQDDRVLWARRSGRNGWQFPQGGIKPHETPEQALFRELHEEVGLGPQHVEVLGRTNRWLRYEIPSKLRRPPSIRLFKGQKQVWFLLRLLGSDEDVRLDLSDNPEFDDWCWIEYWSALETIIAFKREVYRQALAELEPLLGAKV
jgi:putative (di)nucleoside polyphosphate hydrolase